MASLAQFRENSISLPAPKNSLINNVISHLFNVFTNRSIKSGSCRFTGSSMSNNLLTGSSEQALLQTVCLHLKSYNNPVKVIRDTSKNVVEIK